MYDSRIKRSTTTLFFDFSLKISDLKIVLVISVPADGQRFDNKAYFSQAFPCCVVLQQWEFAHKQ